jgi:hypothetical protein
VLFCDYHTFKGGKMIEKLFEYGHNGIKYVFMRDCHFTLVQGRVIGDANGSFMIGAAFCTKEDEYRVDIGCHVALERFCKNLHFDREQRVDVHNKLDEVLGNQITEEQIRSIGKQIDYLLSRMFSTPERSQGVAEEDVRKTLFGDPATEPFQIIIQAEKGKSKCQ